MLASLPLLGDSSSTPERSVTKLAEGVYEIRHEDPPLGFVNGNTTVIIGSREVFVVDSCSVASAAQEDIAQIRKWTDKPVRYLLNTHWHHDHNAGNIDYRDAFPGLAIVAHAETKAMLDATSPTVAAGIIKSAIEARSAIEKALQSGIGSDGKPLTDARRKRGEKMLADSTKVIDDAKNYKYAGPTLAFRDELIIDLGDRIVEVKQLGRGNTGGDAVVYLPKEKILVTGDLVVHPVPYTFDGYPSEWIGTLDKLAAVDADVIVPGHGDVEHDKKYILQLRNLMKSIVTQVDTQVHINHDVSLDDVKKSVDIKKQREEILGGDEANGSFFDYAMDSFVGLVYNEAKQR